MIGNLNGKKRLGPLPQNFNWQLSEQQKLSQGMRLVNVNQQQTGPGVAFFHD
jgi:hypothetical protein